MSFAAWNIMNVGGVCVTFAYGTGASVPLLNAFVYSSNLFLNMVFQIALKISPYTKNMRCGTLLFVLVAIQLGQMAPPPVQVNPGEDLRQTSAIVWMVVFTILSIGSLIVLLQTRTRPRSSTLKMYAWAIQIACWGSFTDNWAKINGTIEDDMTWYISMGIYFPTGAWVMVMSVWAMAATHVSVYVPTNLCIQLCMNTISAFALWNEADYLESTKALVAYVVGYVICCMAVYITAEDMDLVADLQNIKEMRSGQLSNGRAVSDFGTSLIDLANAWSPAAQKAEDDPASRQKAIRNMLTEGADAKAFRESDLIDLAVRLWSRISPGFLPVGSALGWMQNTPYFQDYIARDAAFGEALTQTLAPEEIQALAQEQAEMTLAQEQVEMALV